MSTDSIESAHVLQAEGHGDEQLERGLGEERHEEKVGGPAQQQQQREERVPHDEPHVVVPDGQRLVPRAANGVLPRGPRGGVQVEADLGEEVCAHLGEGRSLNMLKTPL